MVAVHEAAGGVPGCRGVAWAGGEQCGHPLHHGMQWRGALVGQGSCPLPQGSVVAVGEGSGSGKGERLALRG